MSNRPFLLFHRTALPTAILLLLCGCGDRAPGNSAKNSQTGPRSAAAPAAVLVTHPVLQEVAAAITADTDITVAAALPDLLDSRNWRPRSQSIRAMQQATLIVMNGASWEPWTSRVSLPASRLVVTSRAFTEELITVPDAVTHQHGPQGRHSHPGVIPATWLSPTLLEAQTDALQTALLHQFPAHRETLNRNAAAWKTTLQQPKRLALELREATQNQPPAIIADSPLFLYLLRDLGWESTYLAGNESGPAEPEQLQQLRELADKHPPAALRLFLLSDQRPADMEQAAADLGLKPLRLDQGLADGKEQSIAQRLTRNLELLRKAVTESGQ